jgi:Ras family protein T1
MVFSAKINEGSNNTCKQVKCFNAPLQPSEIVGVRRAVSEKLCEGVNDSGLTWTGFLFLHQKYIEQWRLEITWTILRKFGYNNDMKLAEAVIPSTSKRAPDQVIYRWGKLQLL